MSGSFDHTRVGGREEDRRNMEKVGDGFKLDFFFFAGSMAVGSDPARTHSATHPQPICTAIILQMAPCAWLSTPVELSR